MSASASASDDVRAYYHRVLPFYDLELADRGDEELWTWAAAERLTPKTLGRYNLVMKVETTVALSEDLVAALDSRTQDAQDRSAIVEAALRAYLARPRRGEDAGDLEIINAHSAELNEEAADVLAYQVIP